MDRLTELKADMATLDLRLDGALAALGDPESKVNGGDVAAIARERRTLGELIADADQSFDWADNVRRDFDRLGQALELVGGSSAAVVVRERRLQSAVLVKIETPEVVPLVDELAARRAGTASARPPARRRKSR